MPCGARGEHCCWIDGKECDWLRPGTDGRAFDCAIRLDHESWAEAHEDPRYQPIRAHLRSLGASYDCGNYPPPGRRCNACGEVG